jgi:hypothetical protein
MVPATPLGSGSVNAVLWGTVIRFLLAATGVQWVTFLRIQSVLITTIFWHLSRRRTVAYHAMSALSDALFVRPVIPHHQRLS